MADLLRLVFVAGAGAVVVVVAAVSVVHMIVIDFFSDYC